MRHHTLAKLTFLVSALIGTVLPILVLGASEPSASQSGEGADLGPIVQQALQAAGEMEEGQNKCLVLLDLARFQLGTGARQAAKEATRQAIQSGRAIRSPIRRAGVLAKCSRAQAEIGDQATARELLQESLSIARDLNRKVFPSPRPPPGTRHPYLRLDLADWVEITRATEEIVGAQAEIGDYDQAFQTLGEPLFLHGIALGRIIRYLKGKDHDTVRRVSERAVQVVRGSKDFLDKSSELEIIAMERAGLGDFEGAIQTADLLGDLARINTNDRRDGGVNYQVAQAAVLAEVAMAQADAGDREGAERSRQRARQIALGLAETSAKQLAFALASVPRTLAQVGEVPRAIQVANSIRDPTYRLLACADIAIVQAKAGDRDAARRNLARVLHEVNNARLDLRLKPMLYSKLANALAGVGDVPGALSATAALKEVRPSERDWRINSRNDLAAMVKSQSDALARAYTEIAKVQAEAGDFRGALRTADLIPLATEDATKAGALEIIARLRAKAGDAQGAIDEPSGASPPLLKARTLLGVARGIHERQATGGRPTPPTPP